MGLTVLELEVGNPAHPKGDSVLLGALTLESLGLALDPLRRELKALPMLLATLGSSSGL